MKPARIIIFALAALIPIFSAIAQDDEDFQLREEELGPGKEELGPGMEDFGADDEDVPVEGRTLGLVPGFGLGLLGGAFGSSVVRGVGSFLGLRKPPLPFFRPAPAAFYPAPFVPSGYPYTGLPGRTAGRGVPGRAVRPLTPYVPALPLAPAIPISYYRSNEDDQDEQQGEEFYDNETY